ncbi:CNNM domain-containing protein [Methanolobus sp. ZRKC3]|uniref:DUF21 domain-containing protein n=1 Tax=Methanolobus sp. ZRKC3 TaxID=3125786 RepID=UPI00324E82A9
MAVVTWVFIVMCLAQSAIFSGLTIGLFGLTPLRLEIEAEVKNPHALKVLKMRKDSNYLLATLLWGNVGINVLLTLLTDTVMAGATAFVFSTIAITCFGEIMPQAYFSRNALKMGAYLTPLVTFYQIILFPVAKPSAILLDWWLGKEKVQFYKERAFRIMIEKHMDSSISDIDHLEAMGALNFLAIDDLNIKKEGSVLDTRSIIQIPFRGLWPVFPDISSEYKDPFLKKMASSGKKWIILIDENDNPRMAVDSDGFLRGALQVDREFKPHKYCHRPLIVSDPKEKIGTAMNHLKVYPIDAEDDVIDEDIILYWNRDDPERRIITGSDILGRLLRGIVVRVE